MLTSFSCATVLLLSSFSSHHISVLNFLMCKLAGIQAIEPLQSLRWCERLLQSLWPSWPCEPSDPHAFPAPLSHAAVINSDDALSLELSQFFLTKRQKSFSCTMTPNALFSVSHLHEPAKSGPFFSCAVASSLNGHNLDTTCCSTTSMLGTGEQDHSHVEDRFSSVH